MAIQSIGTGGLDPIEKAQLLSSFSKNQVSGLVNTIPASKSDALSNQLLNQIYDQKAITPQVRSALAAKQAALEKSQAGESESADATTNKASSINDSLIAANREASSSAVPDKRPDPVVKIDVVS